MQLLLLAGLQLLCKLASSAAVLALTQSVSSVQDLSDHNRAQISELGCMVKQTGDKVAAVGAEVKDKIRSVHPPCVHTP
jgi:hypothetical protein